uniref:Activin_recp domain-containing protein n=1 Tax=Panagrellus redivivus TaxID=6233 RepID=A0A7E4W438_PANRE
MSIPETPNVDENSKKSVRVNSVHPVTDIRHCRQSASETIMFKHTLLLALAMITVSNALKCYQGMQNASYPLSGVASDCTAIAVTCTKLIDFQTNSVYRACRTSNCTANGKMTSSSHCHNEDSHVINCCCYDDGCNTGSSYSYIAGILMAVIGITATIW